MADPSYSQQVERLVFAAHHAHSKSRMKNQLKHPSLNKGK